MMSRQSQRSQPYTVGFLGTMAIVLAFIVFMYATTFPSTQVWTVVGAVCFLGFGLAMAYIMVGVKFEPFKVSTLFASFLWTAISFVAIYIVNEQVPFNLDVTPVSNQWFSVLQGVGEECFFRLWLTTFIKKATKSPWLAILVGSGIWTLYHLARYGGNMTALLIVGGAGVMLGFALLQSRLADGCIFAHALVNFLATV